MVECFCKNRNNIAVVVKRNAVLFVFECARGHRKPRILCIRLVGGGNAIHRKTVFRHFGGENDLAAGNLRRNRFARGIFHADKLRPLWQIHFAGDRVAARPLRRVADGDGNALLKRHLHLPHDRFHSVFINAAELI